MWMALGNWRKHSPEFFSHFSRQSFLLTVLEDILIIKLNKVIDRTTLSNTRDRTLDQTFHGERSAPHHLGQDGFPKLL